MNSGGQSERWRHSGRWARVEGGAIVESGPERKEADRWTVGAGVKGGAGVKVGAGEGGGAIVEGGPERKEADRWTVGARVKGGTGVEVGVRAEGPYWKAGQSGRRGP
jgi:hypothetical protein